MAKLVIRPSKYDRTAKHICWYHLYKDGTYTGKSMLLAVESIVDGLNAVNRMVEPIGLTAQIGWYGDESVHNQARVEMLYQVLEKWNYIGTAEFVGDDVVFGYEEWMAKLVN
jgi:hypothetical protein